jgi:CubicO group peptidase (beta-lactamase class C family)
MRFFVLALLLFLLNSCHVCRFFYWNFADVNDHKKFQSLPVLNNNIDSFHFKTSKQLIDVHKMKFSMGVEEIPFSKLLQSSKTLALLIIRNDSILLEHYLDNYNKNKVVPSFSVAKSFVSALVGIAVDDGLIHSVKDRITKYIPELPEKNYGKISIEDLLDMRSGLNYNENYINPFGHVAKSYYGLNLKKYSAELKLKNEPGSKFEYISVNTQLLGWLVQNACKKSISHYLEEKIWKPLGMEYAASWSIDSKKFKLVKAFCCLNACARDYAKFGRLYLKRGNWNGRQIISEKWIDASLDFDKTNFYSYQWWRKPRNPQEGDFFARGILGQFIYVNPTKNLIIVRLGEKEGNLNWPLLFQSLSDQF